MQVYIACTISTFDFIQHKYIVQLCNFHRILIVQKSFSPAADQIKPAAATLK